MTKIDKIIKHIEGYPPENVPKGECPECHEKKTLVYTEDWQWCKKCKTLWEWN